MSRETARIAVAKGATLLDHNMPGWWRRIDLERLRLSSSTECVLGQLYDEERQVPRWRTFRTRQVRRMTDVMAEFGFTRAEAQRKVCQANYDLGTATLGLGVSEAIEHGFASSGHASYRDLDRAWAELIAGRQALAVLEDRHPELLP